MTKHTPGPWVATFFPDQDRWDVDTDKDNGENFYIAEIVGGCGREKDEANARLIAAAPELLAALDALLKRYVGMVESGDCGFWNAEEEPQVIAARAAIAKAEG